MHDFLISGLLWIKAAHVVSAISWMAGLLYLPRLFVYHASAGPAGSQTSETFKVMERKLYRAIMDPAMTATWVFGLALAWLSGFFAVPPVWFLVKAAAVIVMTGIHIWLGLRLRDFANDDNKLTPRTWRIINEVPAVLLIIIIIAVIVRPFG